MVSVKSPNQCKCMIQKMKQLFIFIFLVNATILFSVQERYVNSILTNLTFYYGLLNQGTSSIIGQQAVNKQISQNLISYEPTVSVTTKKSENHVIITVSDNGNGIPQNIVDKIFQPFFTTKPTGQRTGLSLSLSYDIIKAHGGEIKVGSKEGEGSKFIIQIPIN